MPNPEEAVQGSRGQQEHHGIVSRGLRLFGHICRAAALTACRIAARFCPGLWSFFCRPPGPMGPADPEIGCAAATEEPDAEVAPRVKRARGPDSEPLPCKESAANALLDEAKKQMAALMDSCEEVAAWLVAGGPNLGVCAASFGRLSEPVVLACGHAVCRRYASSTTESDVNKACAWAPSCKARAFPAGMGGRSMPEISLPLDGILKRCCGADASTPAGEVAAAATEEDKSAAIRRARSPLEAIRAYEALGELRKEEAPAEALAAFLAAAELYARFAVAAPMMASKFDQFRLGADIRAIAGTRGLHGDAPAKLGQCIASLASPTAAPDGPALSTAIDALPLPGAGRSRAPSRIDRTKAADDLLAGLAAGASEPLVKELVECAVCYRTLCEPVALACGHSFCKICLARQLDFERGCPLCREDLGGFIDQYAVSAQLAAAISATWPEEVEQGRQAAEKEAEDMREWLPIFVCMLALPSQPCPLHIFEPRYRLMMRRAVTSGLRRFGMCLPMRGDPEYAQNGFSRMGTVLFIREIRMLPDGRSLVDTIGERRFRVIESSERDGYAVARVEYLDEAFAAGDFAVTNAIAECRSVALQLRQALHSRLSVFAMLQGGEDEDSILGTSPLPEDDLSFFWTTVESLPIAVELKFRIFATTGRAEQCALLANVMRAVLNGVQGMPAERQEEREEEQESDGEDEEVPSENR
eukprot:gnl/TRDRNA2_/TRDRNA2_92557_c0_seq1.p1 gnl/TRDRNA2_/TRDRNA2_92557_c0~~gnl/TRDRNA2_/TRDRNA2_92557_c0_seq1.p1  ORF type:complete len:716 (-),score=134.60 gnl/TRDRNA2_/TRDRNA2_92557_c0_seq1:63-2165(-)